MSGRECVNFSMAPIEDLALKGQLQKISTTTHSFQEIDMKPL